jgi:hypothetical protein
MTKLNADSSVDAFRLGCYAAAKHAGATHDEALGFVRDLEVQESRQAAFRLGTYKVARDAGASSEEATEFMEKVSKAWLKGLWKTTQDAVRGLGNKVTGGVEHAAKNIHDAKGVATPFAPGKALGWMKKNPGTVGGGALAVGAPAAYGAGRLAFGGGAPEAGGEGGKGGEGGGKMDPETRALLHFLMMNQMQLQQGPGFGYNPYVYGR